MAGVELVELVELAEHRAGADAALRLSHITRSTTNAEDHAVPQSFVPAWSWSQLKQLPQVAWCPPLEVIMVPPS